MAISATEAVGASAVPQSSNIKIEDFLKILTAQLNNQDPLKPVDNEQFIAQIAQFANLEQSRQLNTKIDALLASQSSMQSIGLLGKTVELAQGGLTVKGIVSAVALDSGQPLLSVTLPGGTVQTGISISQLLNVH